MLKLNKVGKEQKKLLLPNIASKEEVKVYESPYSRCNDLKKAESVKELDRS